MNSSETIAAIATPIGEGGIGIVRLSGPDALRIADKIFVPKEKKKPSEYKTYTIHYGFIVDPLTRYLVEPPKDGCETTKIIDEVILTVMRAPKSYTKEDVVEINCHGGIVALRSVLELVLKNGCRMADPGEFTKRAFLNGRIDLAQAEAVVDIIKAKTDSSLKISTEQLRGVFSGQINEIKRGLFNILVILEANIDFPEEEIGSTDFKKIHDGLYKINQELKTILESAKYGRVMRDGLHAVICGKPNVGKSSLLNALLRQERSIVSPVAGTTRDTVEEIIDIKGIPVRIVDTAGIIEPRDLVEKKAVSRAKRYMDLADLIILIFDGSKRLSRQDHALIQKLKTKPVIALVNKIDLKQKIDRGALLKRFARVIDICAKKGRNINLLEEAIKGLVYGGEVPGAEPALMVNLRHVQHLKKVQKVIEQALNSLDNKLSPEFIAQDLKYALDGIGQILGSKFSEELLDKIFSEFCIGK